MPRNPRVFVPGAIYHVYNKISSGEAILAEASEAEELIDLMREAKRRDGWTILAWAVMANHYHFVAQVAESPLWRGLHHIQNVFSRRFNARHDRTGPLWQSRYRAKMVRDERYLDRVITYVHLNPVRAGVVSDPSRYPYSGHLEILGKRTWDLVDVDNVLGYFAANRQDALHRYRSAVAAMASATRESLDADRASQKAPTGSAVWFPKGVPYLDALGVSSAPERPQVSPQRFVEAACAALGVHPERVAGHVRDQQTVRARWLLASLAIGRWRLRSAALAEQLGKLPEVVSRWAGMGAHRRLESDEFREAYERLDEQLRAALAGDP